MSEEIKVLNDHQHIRLRTEMYLGSRSEREIPVPILVDGKLEIQNQTYVPAVMTAFREAFDNALDEMSFIGKGRIDVLYRGNGWFSVSDNGRGIPLTFNKELNEYAPTTAVSRTKAGRNFGDRGQVAGQNGVGISAVNSCSSIFQIKVDRDGKSFSQEFDGDQQEELVIKEPYITNEKNPSSTFVSFQLSSKVFDKMTLPVEMVESYIYMVAAVNPKIKFFFNGNEIKTHPKIETSLFGEKKMMRFDIAKDDTSMVFLLKNGVGQNQFSLVNNIPAFDGGSHVKEFEKSFVRNLMEALTRESKKRKLPLHKSDIMGDLFIFNSTKMDAPTFDSQSKTRLTNNEIIHHIYPYLNEYDWAKFIRQNKDFIEEIFDVAAKRNGQANKGDLDKEAKKLKKKKIPNLIDATSKDRSNCKLVLFEGLSAASTFTSVRDPKIHGALPLRGKVMNTWGADTKKVISSEALAQIASAVGLFPGKPVDFESLRYQEIIIACDADVDGMNIYCLLCAFFYKFWPELMTEENCRIKLLKTPLIILKKKGSKEQHYIYEESSFDMKDYPDHSFVARAKGLGSLQRQEWVDHSVEDDSNLIPIYDDGNLERTFELLFGPDSDARKMFMEVSVDETLESFEGTEND